MGDRTQGSEERLRSAFTEMAADYDQDRFGDPPLRYFNEIENAAIHRLLGDLSGLRVLDVGSGTGRIAIPLARAGARVVAADLTEEMTRVARGKALADGPLPLRFCLASARQLPFKAGSFDALTSVRMFHLIPKAKLPEFLREMRAAVKPGGTMVLEFNSATYAGIMGILRDLKNLRLARTRGMNRTYVMYPWQVRSLFRGAGDVEVHGVYLPLQWRLHGRSPRLAEALSRWASRFPFNYLSKNLLVRVRVPRSGTR